MYYFVHLLFQVEAALSAITEASSGEGNLLGRAVHVSIHMYTDSKYCH